MTRYEDDEDVTQSERRARRNSNNDFNHTAEGNMKTPKTNRTTTGHHDAGLTDLRPDLVSCTAEGLAPAQNQNQNQNHQLRVSLSPVLYALIFCCHYCFSCRVD